MIVYFTSIPMTTRIDHAHKHVVLVNKIMSRKRTPSEFLKQITGRPVAVKLNSGIDYRGMYIEIDLSGVTI